MTEPMPADELKRLKWTELARSQRHVSFRPDDGGAVVTVPASIPSEHLFRMIYFGDRGDYSFQKTNAREFGSRRRDLQRMLIGGLALNGAIMILGTISSIRTHEYVYAGLYLVVGGGLLVVAGYGLWNRRWLKRWNRRKVRELRRSGVV